MNTKKTKQTNKKRFILRKIPKHDLFPRQQKINMDFIQNKSWYNSLKFLREGTMPKQCTTVRGSNTNGATIRRWKLAHRLIQGFVEWFLWIYWLYCCQETVSVLWVMIDMSDRSLASWLYPTFFNEMNVNISREYKIATDNIPVTSSQYLHSRRNH